MNMKNVSAGVSSRTRFASNGFYSEVLVDQIDKNRLKYFFKLELEYYNNLLINFQNKNRLYKEIMARTPDILVRFLSIAISKGWNENQFREKYPEYVRNNVTKGANLGVFLNFLDSEDYNRCHKFIVGYLLKNSDIHVLTRKGMAEEMYKFFINQAKILQEEKSGEFLYKVSPPNIIPPDSSQKRHVQLKRDALQYRYSEEEDASYLSTPYTVREIKVPGWNIGKATWNMIIIHQTPNMIPLEDTPWVINFVKSKEEYLLRYLDNPNPDIGSAFRANMPRIYRKR